MKVSYNVRSRLLVDIYNDLSTEKIVLSPHFQRKLVWRLTHKVDFIRTILMGFPFPEIFISRGKIDVDTMSSVSAVVDGQQRLNSIMEFIEGAFSVDGLTFTGMSPSDKEQFLKYEIAVIELDLSSDDSRVEEIFKRLNRTFYALSTIEKMSTEYRSVEFMLVAKLLAGEFYDEGSVLNIDPQKVLDDPSLSDSFVKWANSLKIHSFHKFVLESKIFTSYELSRQVHLMYVLNLMASCELDYYTRNDGPKRLLEEYRDASDWESRDSLIEILVETSVYINKLKPKPAVFWSTKSNAFSLFVEIASCIGDGDALPTIRDLRDALESFALSASVEYRQAAKEGVNNLKERVIRGEEIRPVLGS